MKGVAAEVIKAKLIFSVEDLDVAFEETMKLLSNWCFNPWAQFKPRQVVVLAPEGTRAMWPAEDDSQIPFTRSYVDWLAGKDVLITSWDNCGFIEADVVVVIEMPKDDNEFGKDSIGKHLARSRARKVLTVFQVKADVGMGEIIKCFKKP